MKPQLIPKRVLVFGALVFCATMLIADGPCRALASEDKLQVTQIAAYQGQITKTQVELPDNNSLVKVVNRTNSYVDVDFIAFDKEDNEVARETAVVGPNIKIKLSLQDLFPELSFSDLSSIHIQSSVRPLENEVNAPGLLSLAPYFFSQLDARWSANTLGTCSGTTIRSGGCAISCIAMAGARSVNNWNPATVNTYLTNNRGYVSGCNVIWSAAANVDGSGGFTYIGSGSVGSAASLKSLIDSGKVAIARSARFSSHFGIVLGYNRPGTRLSDFYYLDPADRSAVFRTVGDGWVTATSGTQIYR